MKTRFEVHMRLRSGVVALRYGFEYGHGCDTVQCCTVAIRVQLRVRLRAHTRFLTQLMLFLQPGTSMATSSGLDKGLCGVCIVFI